MHIVTLSFDDGFRASNIRIARIYERFGLRACLNVLAAPAGEMSPEQSLWGTDRGDFVLWNELQANGHEIMPHGYNHSNKHEMSFRDAKDSILRCLDIFGEKLSGFDPKRAIFNFPYNQATPELEAWLPTVVRAFRRGGGGLNPLLSPSTVRLTTTSSGPENCEWHLNLELEVLMSLPEGWLIYGAHGLDDEGWGPIRSSYLERLLEQLVSSGVEVLPAGAVLARADGVEA